MTYTNIGKATVPTLWISVVVALLILSLLYRKSEQIKALNDVTFTYMLVWKLSYIPLSFSSFIATPLSLLYFSGGQVGHILGVIVGAVQLYRKRIADEGFFTQLSAVRSGVDRTIGVIVSNNLITCMQNIDTEDEMNNMIQEAMNLVVKSR